MSILFFNKYAIFYRRIWLTVLLGLVSILGLGSILTRNTAIILTGTILRMRTFMTIAPYQEGDSLAPDPAVILFNNQPSRFTGVAALCFTTL